MYMEKQFGWTVTVMTLNDESEAFMEWFAKSKFTEDFTVEEVEHEGEDYVEITSHNPFFSLDALEEVYLTLTGKNKHACKNCQEKAAEEKVAEEETTEILEKVKNNTNLN